MSLRPNAEPTSLWLRAARKVYGGLLCTGNSASSEYTRACDVFSTEAHFEASYYQPGERERAL